MKKTLIFIINSSVSFTLDFQLKQYHTQKTRLQNKQTNNNHHHHHPHQIKKHCHKWQVYTKTKSNSVPAYVMLSQQGGKKIYT